MLLLSQLLCLLLLLLSQLLCFALLLQRFTLLLLLVKLLLQSLRRSLCHLCCVHDLLL